MKIEYKIYNNLKNICNKLIIMIKKIKKQLYYQDSFISINKNMIIAYIFQNKPYNKSVQTIQYFINQLKPIIIKIKINNLMIKKKNLMLIKTQCLLTGKIQMSKYNKMNNQVYLINKKIIPQSKIKASISISLSVESIFIKKIINPLILNNKMNLINFNLINLVNPFKNYNKKAI